MSIQKFYRRKQLESMEISVFLKAYEPGSIYIYTPIADISLCNHLKLSTNGPNIFKTSEIPLADLLPIANE